MEETHDKSEAIIEIAQIDGIIAAAGVEGADEIMTAFWQSTDDLVQSMHEAMNSNDFDAAQKVAHALKGSSSNVGASALSRITQQFEAYCHDGAADNAKTTLSAIETCVDQTRRAYSDYFAAA